MNSLNSAYSSAKKIFTYSKVKKEEKIKKFQIYEVIRYCIYENILHK